MNYRHGFHAGNFADVFKHATMVRILLHLRGKPAAFRVLDTHAGAGSYDLFGAEASRGGEWRTGIGRLIEAPLPEDARALLKPYLDAVMADNRAGELAIYPGSPVLAQAFLRPQDRLTACELEPKSAAALVRQLHGDRRSKAIAIDGWTALKAYLPPKERRGLVLIDPSFEDADEFPRLGLALEAAQRKWRSGIYLAWYPIKERAAPAALERRLRGCCEAPVLRAELRIAASASENNASSRLCACGLIAINPPWTLAGELAVLLPALARALAKEDGAHRLDWLVAES